MTDVLTVSDHARVRTLVLAYRVCEPDEEARSRENAAFADLLGGPANTEALAAFRRRLRPRLHRPLASKFRPLAG